MDWFKKLTTTNGIVIMIFVLLLLFVWDYYHQGTFFGLLKPEEGTITGTGVKGKPILINTTTKTT